MVLFGAQGLVRAVSRWDGAWAEPCGEAAELASGWDGLSGLVTRGWGRLCGRRRPVPLVKYAHQPRLDRRLRRLPDEKIGHAVQVDFSNIELARSVLERQANEHLPALKNHFDTWAKLESSDLGLVLQVFSPANGAVVAVGDQVLDAVQKVYAQGAASLNNVIETYADADLKAHELLESLAASMGESIPPFEDPRENLPALGAARDDAGPYYRSGDPNLFQQAYEDGYKAGDTIRGELFEDMPNRVGEALGSKASVTEEQDVQSYLVTPTGSASEIENLRWSAGLILGSLDWVFEKLFGFSALNDLVFKPFAGDWNRVECASGAWKIASDAFGAISENTTGILPGLAEWTGKGSEQFALAAAAMAAVDKAISSVAGTISTVVKGFAFLVKETASWIGNQLRDISYDLAAIAAEAAIPVVGWAAAVINMAVKVSKIADTVKTIYKYINMIYDFVSNIIEARAKVFDTYRQVLDVVEALGRGAVVRV